jgi:hypothetical protein
MEGGGGGCREIERKITRALSPSETPLATTSAILFMCTVYWLYSQCHSAPLDYTCRSSGYTVRGRSLEGWHTDYSFVRCFHILFLFHFYLILHIFCMRSPRPATRDPRPRPETRDTSVLKDEDPHLSPKYTSKHCIRLHGIGTRSCIIFVVSFSRTNMRAFNLLQFVLDNSFSILVTLYYCVYLPSSPSRGENRRRTMIVFIVCNIK